MSTELGQNRSNIVYNVQGIDKSTATGTGASDTEDGEKKNGEGAAKAAGAASSAISEAPGVIATVQNASKSTDEKMDAMGNVTHEVDWGGNIGSMAAAGATVGSAFGPWGTLIGGAVGAVGGTVTSIIDNNNQPTVQDRVEKKRQFEKGMMMQSIKSNDEMPVQMQAAKHGRKEVGEQKTMELEKDEIVLRRNGKSFKKVADFKGGKTHEDGGEIYEAKEGDIIIPRKKAAKVERDLRLRNWPSVESVIQTLPKDTPENAYADGGVREVNTGDRVRLKEPTITVTDDPLAEAGEINQGWTAEKVQAYIDKYKKKGEEPLVSGATLLRLANKNDFPIELALAQGRMESRFGTDGAAVPTQNIYNWGNITEGDKLLRSDALKSNTRKSYSTAEKGVEAYMSGVKKNYLDPVGGDWRKLINEEFVNGEGDRYAKEEKYESLLGSTLAELDEINQTAADGLTYTGDAEADAVIDKIRARGKEKSSKDPVSREEANLLKERDVTYIEPHDIVPIGGDSEEDALSAEELARLEAEEAQRLEAGSGGTGTGSGAGGSNDPGFNSNAQDPYSGSLTGRSVDGMFDTSGATNPNGSTGEDETNPWVTAAADTLGSLSSFAPAIYNLAKGNDRPETTERRFITPATMDYNFMSQAQLNEVDNAFTAAMGNARNMSGGMMSNYRSNVNQAWADKIARKGKVNQFEAGRADEISKYNTVARHEADVYNNKVNNEADILDMKHRAATDRFTAQGYADLANIGAMRRRDKNAENANNTEREIIQDSFGRTYTNTPNGPVEIEPTPNGPEVSSNVPNTALPTITPVTHEYLQAGADMMGARERDAEDYEGMWG